MIRQMINEFEGFRFYESTFDTETGNLVRVAEVPDDPYDSLLKEIDDPDTRQRFIDRDGFNFYRSREAYSPVPETVDVQITNRCPMGCDFCYQDSKVDSPHGPKDLIKEMINGFEQPPYQIAIGGGEPTTHPDFAEILYRTSELGSVPNYTTAGFKLHEDVVEATNEVCGGVAMTYHAHRGLDWFKKHYSRIREQLDVQLNVHLIASDDVIEHLDQLIDAQDEIGNLNVVLLAYYPDIGRASLSDLPSKNVYHRKLPEAIDRALKSGMTISYSEGLIPYFISRPEIEVNTEYMMASEGNFSCYVDMNGRMSYSSFSPPRENSGTIFEEGSQKLWNGLVAFNDPKGSKCRNCEHYNSCTTPSIHHYFMCAYAKHNQ